jgi:probable HAF family extracellular repeat protein
MTLNITVVSRAGIHQSADFRISKTEKGADGSWIELQPNSSKIVSLHFKQWSGLLTYCGIGLWNGKRTDEYAAEWLAGLPESTAIFEESVERLRDQGTAWIRGINQALKRVNAHSFVLAGYEEGIAVYAIISNCQTLTGHIHPVSDELRVDMRRSKAGVHVFITGIRNAVPDAASRRLKRLVKHGSPGNVIRFELANINRVASGLPVALNGISPACLAYSLDFNGGANGEVHGDVPGPVIPRTLLHGSDLSKVMAGIMSSSPNAKLRGSTVVTTESNLATLRQPITCAFRVNKGIDKGDIREFATLEEVGAINEYWLSVHRLNNARSIVGQFRNPFDSLPRAFVWPSGQNLQDLGTLGGPSSQATCVNDKGQVVGTASADQAASHAFLWTTDVGMRDLGTLGGRDSIAQSINTDGQIVGDSYVGAGEPRQEAERAFLWTPSDGMINLGAQFESWSRAVAINRHGLVLGWRRRGTVICGFVWSSTLGHLDIDGDQNSPFIALALNDSGLVVGQEEDSAGKRHAFTWTRSEGLRRMAVPEEFHPSDVDINGNIIGNLYSLPWHRPYLYRPTTEEFLPLPFVEEHHTSVWAINDNGVIVGAARTESWKHSHPLIWHLNASFLSG